MSISMKYIDIPVGAQEAAAVRAASPQPFGSGEQVTAGTADTPWATLEPGSWTLDGTRQLLPDEAAQIGWWSMERSGDDGRFAQPPVIVISFPETYTATGLTFRFWPSLGHWCSEVHVAWYNGETCKAETLAYPDDPQWILSKVVEGFDRIEIELLATNVPGQFAKIGQLQIGHVVVFGQDEITRVSLLNEVDPSACELSVDTMTVEIRDRKNRALLPQKNQSMHLYRDGQQIAAHYVTDSSREAQQYYIFQCQSVIGRLEEEFPGGLYKNAAVGEVLDQVLEGFAYVLDERLAQETVTGYLPACTRRQALQQIAFAIGGAVTTQGDGIIRLTPPERILSGSFEKNSIFTGAKLNREAQTAAVKVLSHSYDESGEDSTSLWSRENGDVSAAEKGNVVSVENATLINTDNAEATLDRLYEYHSLKHVLTQQVVVSDQMAGQLVRSPNPWGTVTEGYITSMESEFTSNGHTAKVTIRGKEVQTT